MEISGRQCDYIRAKLKKYSYLNVEFPFPSYVALNASNISHAGSAAELIYPLSIAISQQDFAKSRLSYESKN